MILSRWEVIGAESSNAAKNSSPGEDVARSGAPWQSEAEEAMALGRVGRKIDSLSLSLFIFAYCLYFHFAIHYFIL